MPNVSIPKIEVPLNQDISHHLIPDEPTVFATFPVEETASDNDRHGNSFGRFDFIQDDVDDDRREWADTGRYTIRRCLGVGATGAVYLAYDELLGRDVAIKRLHPALRQNAKIVQRFYDEALLLSQLRHANIGAFHELGRLQGVPNFAMEYIEGESLASIMERGPLPWTRANQICIKACQGLDAAHSQRIVHGDLKPANLMLSKKGEVKIIDFGLSKRLNLPVDAIAPCTVAGTPAYMSPEQCRGDALSERSDIYALGATCFALLTGVPPYSDCESVPELMSAQCHAAPPNPRLINPGVPQDVVDIVQRAMAKDPDQRFQSMCEFKDALQTALNNAPSSSEITPSPLSVQRRNRTEWKTPVQSQLTFACCVAAVLLGFDALGHLNGCHDAQVGVAHPLNRNAALIGELKSTHYDKRSLDGKPKRNETLVAR